MARKRYKQERNGTFMVTVFTSGPCRMTTLEGSSALERAASVKATRTRGLCRLATLLRRKSERVIELARQKPGSPLHQLLALLLCRSVQRLRATRASGLSDQPRLRGVERVPSAEMLHLLLCPTPYPVIVRKGQHREHDAGQ